MTLCHILPDRGVGKYEPIMYIYLNVCKQMTDVKLLLLHSNTWNHLTVFKNKWAQALLKMLTKCVYKSSIYIYINSIWH